MKTTSDMILKIDGEVDRPRGFSFDDLASLEPSVQIHDVSKIDPARRGET